MKHIFCLLFAVLTVSASGQSISPLSFNRSNNVVIAAPATNPLTFSNAFAWSTNTLSGATRTNLALGWSALTNTNSSTALLGHNGGTVIYSGTNKLTFTNAVDLSTGQFSNASVGSTVDLARALWDAANDEPALEISDGNVSLQGGDVPGAFRAELGIPWSGLTNTNATAMRSALGLGGNPTNNSAAPPVGEAYVWAASGLWQIAEGGELAFRIDDSEIFIGQYMATTNAPTNTTNVVRWLHVVQGTNNYRIPLYK